MEVWVPYLYGGSPPVQHCQGGWWDFLNFNRTFLPQRTLLPSSSGNWPEYGSWQLDGLLRALQCCQMTILCFVTRRHKMGKFFSPVFSSCLAAWPQWKKWPELADSALYVSVEGLVELTQQVDYIRCQKAWRVKYYWPWPCVQMEVWVPYLYGGSPPVHRLLIVFLVYRGTSPSGDGMGRLGCQNRCALWKLCQTGKEHSGGGTWRVEPSGQPHWRDVGANALALQIPTWEFPLCKLMEMEQVADPYSLWQIGRTTFALMV